MGTFYHSPGGSYSKLYENHSEFSAFSPYASTGVIFGFSITSGGLKPSKASDVRFTLSADHVAGSTSTVIVTFTDGISEWEFPMSARF